MELSEFKQVIGEVVIEHFESSSNEGWFPDESPQANQQELFDDFVSRIYREFTGNANLMRQLPDTSRADMKEWLVEKFRKIAPIIRDMDSETLKLWIANPTQLK